MIRHEALPAQSATLPSRPAQNLAPIEGGIVITSTLDHIGRGKFQLNDRDFAPRTPDVAYPPPPAVGPRTAQILKNP